MFRALDKLQKDTVPDFKQTLPQAHTFLNSYITVQSDLTKKQLEEKRGPEKEKSISIPKYSFYKEHIVTPAIQQSIAKAEVNDANLYTSIIETPRVFIKPVDYKNHSVLSSKIFMSSIIHDGQVAKPVCLKEYSPPSDLPLKIRVSDVHSQALVLRGGALPSYSFCPELVDTSKGPFALECIQQKYIQIGGKVSDLHYPRIESLERYNSLPLWKDVVIELYNVFYSVPKKTSKIQQKFLGSEILWFNYGTNTYIDRVTEYKKSLIQLTSDIDSHFEYLAFIHLCPNLTMDVSLRMQSGKLLYNDSSSRIVTEIKLVSGKVISLLGTWEDSAKTIFDLEYSDGKHPYMSVPKEWFILGQEPNAPLFSWEGVLGRFCEYRLADKMSLTLSPNTKIIETESKFPYLLQLRNGSRSGFAVVKRNINMNSWRTLTCCFLSSSGQGVLLNFGPCMVSLVGKILRIQWTSATLEKSHSFENILDLDSSTPYLLCIGMKSDLETISPNRLVFAVASISDWISGRVGFEVIGPNIVSFITDNFNPLYNISDSFQLCIGDVTHSANAAIAWVRFFDYEMESVDIVRDCTNSWERS